MTRPEQLHSLWAHVLLRQQQGLLEQADVEVLVTVVESLMMIARREAEDDDAEPARPRPELAAAVRMQAAWESGRCCSLVARGLRARVVRAARLVEAGLMSSDEARRIALEAENVALAFAPIPVPPGDLAG